jgi:DNA repair protein RadD
MIWEYLGKSKLQELINPSLLERLEPILPIITLGEIGDVEIYTRKNLARICSSFLGGSYLRKAGNRELLLNSVPVEKLNELTAQLDINAEESFDNKVRKIVRLGWKDTDFCEIFLEWADLPTTLTPQNQDTEQHEELLIPQASPYKVLKDYQYTVFSQTSEALKPNLSRLMIQMPTGSGKTRTAMEIITEFFRSTKEDRVVVWIAHSEELCSQSVDSFKEIWDHVADRPMRLFRAWGGKGGLPYAFEGSAFIVASFQTLYSNLKKNKLAFNELKDRVALVVVDEAHKVIAPTYKEATQALFGNSTRVVGLTATPGRGQDASEENQALSDFFFNQSITILPPKGETVISYLRKRRVLANVSMEPLWSGSNYDATASEVLAFEKLFDFPPGFLSRLGNDDLRNVEIIKRLEQECERGSQILFFACSVEHSLFISSLLQYLGRSSVHIDGSTDKEFRRQALNNFKAKTVQVLCNYGILSTGFDAPQTDVVFISRPTNSIVLYSQMIGRGLRGPAIGGTPTCKLIDVRDNITGFSNDDAVYTYFDGYWTN